MSTRSTVVQLIQTPNGKLSSLLTAVAYLLAHIGKHMAQRKAAGLNPFPSLSVIHTTHFLPLSTAFKPCVIVAFEYIKTCQPFNQGGCTEIEMKQNCDYIGDMFIEVDTPEVACNAVTLPNIVVKPKDLNVYSANGNKSLNFGTGALNNATDELAGTNINVVNGVNYIYDPVAATFVNTQITGNDGKLYEIRVQGINELSGGISYTYVDFQGNFIAGPDGTAITPDVNGFGAGGQAPKVSRANYVRAAELLGLKYFHHNVFKVDDNAISDYHSMALVNFRERRLGPSIRPAFDRLIGQEDIREEIAENHTATGATSTGFAVGAPQLEHSRQYIRRAGGLQTARPFQPSHRLYIPCIHWFNIERKTALPVVCMPDGKLVISLHASPLDQLYFPAPSLFIQETIHAYSVAGGVNGTQADPHIINNRRIPYIIPGSKVTETDCCNRNISLVTCNILLDELIHMMVISRIGFNLISLMREENIVLSDVSKCGNLPVNQLKWPTEYLHINDQPVANYDHTKPDCAENWHRCGYQNKYDASSMHHFTRKGLNLAGNANTYWKENLQLGCTYHRQTVNLVDTLGVNIYDTYFYNKDNRREFYSQYLPYAYSNGYIYGDTLHNSIFITFANIPGIFQPSGFVNLSKTKEMYLEITSNADVSIIKKARLNIQAAARNFLLIADGSCIVRFA